MTSRFLTLDDVDVAGVDVLIRSDLNVSRYPTVRCSTTSVYDRHSPRSTGFAKLGDG